MVTAAVATTSSSWRRIPIRLGDKVPLIRDWRNRASAEPEQIAAWSWRWPSCNWAVLCGAPGPSVLDVEGDLKAGGSGMPVLRELLATGRLDGWTRWVVTPSGGVHLYFVGSDIPKSTLAGLHVDLQSVGGYVLLPGSIVNGISYKLIEERPGGREIQWQAIREALGVETARKSPLVDTFRRETAPPSKGDSKAGGRGAGEWRPIDLFNAAHNIADILAAHGWRHVGAARDGGAAWRHPNTVQHLSAELSECGQFLHNYSTSVGLPVTCPGQPRRLTPFDVYRHLDHGGDLRAAIASLRPGVTR